MSSIIYAHIEVDSDTFISDFKVFLPNYHNGVRVVSSTWLPTELTSKLTLPPKNKTKHNSNNKGNCPPALKSVVELGGGGGGVGTPTNLFLT